MHYDNNSIIASPQNNLSRKFITRFLAMLILVNPPIYSSAKAQTPTSVKKLGAVLGLTGYAADHADGIRRGMELAIEDLKSKNMLFVETHFEDDGTIPVKTVTAVKQLLAKDFHYLIGPTWSFQIKAAAPLIKNSKAIAISPSGSSEVGGGASKGMFFLSPLRSAAEPQIVSFLKEKKFKTAYLLTNQIDWGLVHAALFKKSLEQAGVKILGEEFFDYAMDQATITPLLMKIKLSNPDIILTTGTAGNIFDMVKARDTLQMHCAIFGTENNWELITRGLMKPENIKNVYGMRAPHNPIFTELYRKKYNEDPKQYAAEGYDAVTIFNILAQQPDQDRSSLMSYLFEKLDIKGMSGSISFNADGDIKNPQFEVSAVQ